MDHARLGGPVGREADAGTDACDRRDADDRAPAVRRHVPRRPLAAGHHAEEVDGHDPLEVPQVVTEEAAGRSGDAGVVHHHVEPAEGGHREVDDRLELVGGGDVGALECGGLAETE